MKKIILLFALSLATTISAQIDLRSTRFGVTFGGNYSRVSNAHNPSGPRYTIQGGIVALIPIGSDYQFYLQPEVVYYGAGETGKDKEAKGLPGYNAVYGNSYISIPVSFKGYFSEAESEFFGLIGPRFNILVGQKIKNPKQDYYEADSYGKANSFNFAVGAGVGYSYRRKLELALRYDYGFSNTYKKLKDSPDNLTGDPSTDLRKSEQVFSLSLSYIFD